MGIEVVDQKACGCRRWDDDWQEECGVRRPGEGGIRLILCPDCAFGFLTEHEREDGLHICPLCENVAV